MVRFAFMASLALQTDAAPPAQAEPLHDAFVQAVRRRGAVVETGVFGAHMLIASQADGPVNIILDSRHANRPAGAKGANRSANAIE